MATYNIPPPPPLDLDSTNLPTTFSKFKQAFENFELATGIATRDDSLRVATLLAVIGQPAVDLYNTFEWQAETDKKKLNKVIQKFENHCKGQVNTTYERYVFHTRTQQEGESFEHFYTAVKFLANSCDFGELKDSLIRDRLIIGINNPTLRQRLLREAKLTLEQAILIVRAANTAACQADKIKQSVKDEAQAHSVQYVHPKAKANHGPKIAPTGNSRQQHQQKSHSYVPNNPRRPQTHCYFCGGPYPHSKGNVCPANGKSCAYCHKQNHFAQVCRARIRSENRVNVNYADTMTEGADPGVSAPMTAPESTTTEDDYCFTIGRFDNKLPVVTIEINNSPTSAIIDTGASVNIMSMDTLKSIRPNSMPLQSTNTEIYAFGASKPIEVAGQTSLPVQHKLHGMQATFFITKQKGPTLLCFKTAQQLQIVSVAYNITSSMPSIADEFHDRFQGLGKLRGAQCTLHVDETVQPVTQPHRRIPFHVRHQVEAEVKKLQDLDIIEPVTNQPTPWVSPIRVVPKPKQQNQIRLCVDMRAVNTAIKRERHVTPTIDDIIAKLNGAQIFSKLDLNSGYHQVELDP